MQCPKKPNNFGVMPSHCTCAMCIQYFWPAKLEQCVAVHVVTDVNHQFIREIVEQVPLTSHRHQPWSFRRFGVHFCLHLVLTSFFRSPMSRNKALPSELAVPLMSQVNKTLQYKYACFFWEQLNIWPQSPEIWELEAAASVCCRWVLMPVNRIRRSSCHAQTQLQTDFFYVIWST